jgi:hypothetical protein
LKQWNSWWRPAAGTLIQCIWKMSLWHCRYSDIEFHKNLNEPHEYTRQQELEDVFPQAYKLAKLILTIPATTVLTEQSCSVSKRMTDFLHVTQSQERLSCLSWLNIKSRLLDRLMSKPVFFDDVIDIFATKSRRIGLPYRSCTTWKFN